jgi:hypothetical protein
MKFSSLVQTKVESLICHLHAYGRIELTREEWENVRTFASFLFRDVEDAMLPSSDEIRAGGIPGKD